MKSSLLFSPIKLGALVLTSIAVAGITFLVAPQREKADPASLEVATAIRGVVVSGQLSDLRWPNFSYYKNYVTSFYQTTAYAPAWIKAGAPTGQARAVIETLQESDSKGLSAEDYDGPRWDARLKALQRASREEGARFDVAVTVCLMRYISDLRIGRVNPSQVNFDLDVGPKKYDLALFLRDKLVGAEDPKSQLDEVEPPFVGYKRSQQALQRYLELSHKDTGGQLPVPAKVIEPGGAYDGGPRLRQLLRLFGDLPDDASSPQSPSIYDAALAAAVKRFQARHGLAPDGRLNELTMKELNTPLGVRVEQLRLTLERWRWVPHEFKQPPIVVNIPEFRLRAFDSDGRVGLSTNVIVGKAYRHQTPVFEEQMEFVVFRPYWNVPPSIQRSEIVPAIRRDRNYVAKKGYEVTTRDGTVIASGPVADEVLEQLSSGTLAVRQKPGPSNALGLVKLMFPNDYNVYLHSTPAQELFSRTRRDFSHGCIRVERAAELAAWVLRDKPEWSLEHTRAAMQTGKNNVQVNLSKPLPVLILYGTAVVDDANLVHFFPDIYGHDASLKAELAKGYPHPN